MGAISLDLLLSKAGGSVFCLARMAMLRALEINWGSRPLVDHDPSEKETTIALREIAQGEVLLAPERVQGEQGNHDQGKGEG